MRSFVSALFVAGCVASLSSVPAATAHDGKTAVTSGDICTPVNVAKASRSIQNIRGTVKNISQDESVAVSCPLVTISGNSLFSASVFFENESNSVQPLRCVLRETGVFNLDIQVMAREIDVEPKSFNVVEWQEVELIDPSIDRMNLTCLLPPQSSLGLIATASS